MNEKLVAMVDNLCACGHDENRHHRSNLSGVTVGCVTIIDTGAFCECEQFEAIPALTMAHDEARGSLQVEAAQKMYLQFYNSSGEIGKFFVNDEGRFDFIGEATESARALIEQCKEMWDDIPKNIT